MDAYFRHSFGQYEYRFEPCLHFLTPQHWLEIISQAFAINILLCICIIGATYYSWGFSISIKHLSPDVVSSGFQSLHAFLSFPSRFISRTKRFRPFGYACLSVGLLQSPAADCIVRCSGPYSLLQWTVQSIAADCNNLPFKRPWPTPGNGLFFPLLVIWHLNPRE